MRIKGFWLGLSIFFFMDCAYNLFITRDAFFTFILGGFAIIHMYYAFPEDKETKKK